jgi:hypothetical protein
MIEQIRTGKTSRLLRAGELVLQIWTRSADHHTGPRPLEAPHHKGLTEDRTRSRTCQVKNLLHHGRQPQKKQLAVKALFTANTSAEPGAA